MTSESTALEAEEKQLVIFDLAAETYGVDIGSVREIIRVQEVTKVPRTPDFVEGVINLRGNVIPVIDLRKRFGFRQTEATKDTRIVVVDIGGNDIGVVVDAVTEVLRLAADAVEPPTGVITTADSDHLLGIAKLEDRLIILLDLQQALLNLNQFDSYLDMALQIESDPTEPGGRGNIQNEPKKEAAAVS